MSSSIQENTIGLAIVLTVKEGAKIIDISDATTKKIRFEKPSGDTFEKDADFYTDGKDGKIQYVTINNDLVGLGVWDVQGYVIKPDGTFPTSLVSFEVARNITIS